MHSDSACHFFVFAFQRVLKVGFFLLQLQYVELDFSSSNSAKYFSEAFLGSDFQHSKLPALNFLSHLGQALTWYRGGS